ncbi:unnamed protein product [Kuraishia capsulata CBS 1993]|uniref:F-box domain-containing protein n=1 Tax=Kuraishia capsulata CBS 1993 TaxID=1382522 RepID=W6MTP0_9ASCO|nr:uncharacterized protein KUCA_T00004560001 [Kuraishia capsulata CBS 1993]CDK28577.1 unnamed protein product [Kuraishia capsulata CBS 1993]
MPINFPIFRPFLKSGASMCLYKLPFWDDKRLPSNSSRTFKLLCFFLFQAHSFYVAVSLIHLFLVLLGGVTSCIFTPKIANKRRPKKIRPPYRRYTYGSSEKGDDQKTGDDEDEETEADAEVVVNLQAQSQTPAHFWTSAGSQKIDVLRIALQGKGEDGVKLITKSMEGLSHSSSPNNRMKLPFEIILHIISLTPNPRHLKYTMLSKRFYHALIPDIYAVPKLTSQNFKPFVDTMASHKSKKTLCPMVRELDLSTIIQAGKNSYISKLLRRCSPNLQVFVAPQTSFGVSPLISLKQCQKIRVLDLGLVSETVNLKELFESLKTLPNLEQLSFPRASISCEDFEMNWPSSLWYLRLSGGISNSFLMKSSFPSTISWLEFAHCPYVSDSGIQALLSKIGANLTHLAIHYPMPGLSATCLDKVLYYCPNLIHLNINVEYFSREAFDDDILASIGSLKKLRSLGIDSSGLLGQGFKLDPDDLLIPIAENRFPRLKTIRISERLGWNFKSDSVQQLLSEFQFRGGSMYSF